MTKTQKFLSFISSTQVAPPENIAKVIRAVDDNEQLDLISWKMFGLKITPEGISVQKDFNQTEADKYIQREQKFITMLRDLKVKYNYWKVIPDEISRLFFNLDTNNISKQFALQIDKYFNKIYPKTKTLQIEEILKDKKMCRLYDKVYTDSQKAKISKEEFKKETLFRSTYYSATPLPTRDGTMLAKKAFALFAAETALIFEYFKNPVLLAGPRSIDTYKYEFFKYPKDRPILPKLFVL